MAKSKDAWKALREDIISNLDIRREYENFGVKFTGKTTSKGWAECHAYGREDSTPSAGVNLETGVYKDFTGSAVLYIATEDCPTQFMTEDGKFCRDEDLLKILQDNAADPFGMFQQIVARWAKSEPYSPDEPSIVVGLADLLPYDLLHEWKPTAEVLECFSEDQLQAFAHDHEIEHDQPRAKLIENLIAAWPEGYCPAEVLKACGRAKQ